MIAVKYFSVRGQLLFLISSVFPVSALDRADLCRLRWCCFGGGQGSPGMEPERRLKCGHAWREALNPGVWGRAP